MMGSSTNSVYSPLLLWSQDKLDEERNKLLSCSHAAFLKFLKDDPVGVNEYDLFQAVVRWARNRISGTTTTLTMEEMKNMLAPEGQEDLMGQIRLGLFNRAEWDNLWSSKHSREVGLLPVKVFYCKADFEDIFDATDESERKKIRNLPHMKDFDFRPRGTSAVMGNGVAVEANDAPSVSADPQQSNSNSQCLLDGNDEEVPAKAVSTEPQVKQSGSGSGSSMAPSPPGRRLDFGQSTSLEGHFGETEAKVVSAALQDLSGRPLPSSPGGRLDGRRGKKRSIQSSREKSLSSCNSSSASIQSMDNPNESDVCLDPGNKRVRLVVEEKGPSFLPSGVSEDKRKRQVKLFAEEKRKTYKWRPVDELSLTREEMAIKMGVPNVDVLNPSTGPGKKPEAAYLERYNAYLLEVEDRDLQHMNADPVPADGVDGEDDEPAVPEFEAEVEAEAEADADTDAEAAVRKGNKPANPEHMKAITAEFVRSGLVNYYGAMAMKKMDDCRRHNIVITVGGIAQMVEDAVATSGGRLKRMAIRMVAAKYDSYESFKIANAELYDACKDDENPKTWCCFCRDLGRTGKNYLAEHYKSTHRVKKLVLACPLAGGCRQSFNNTWGLRGHINRNHRSSWYPRGPDVESRSVSVGMPPVNHPDLVKLA